MEDLILKAFERDSYCCQICLLKKHDIRVQFLQPLKFGGECKLENLLTTCFKCDISLKICYDVLDLYEIKFSDSFHSKKSIKTICSLIEKIGPDQVYYSMKTAIDKGLDSQSTIKYFFGICWNKVDQQSYIS